MYRIARRVRRNTLITHAASCAPRLISLSHHQITKNLYRFRLVFVLPPTRLVSPQRHPQLHLHQSSLVVDDTDILSNACDSLRLP